MAAVQACDYCGGGEGAVGYIFWVLDAHVCAACLARRAASHEQWYAAAVDDSALRAEALELINQARAAVRAGKTEQAVAALLAGTSRFCQGQWFLKALAALRSFPSLAEEPRVAWRVGELLLHLGRFEEALAVFMGLTRRTKPGGEGAAEAPPQAMIEALMGRTFQDELARAGEEVPKANGFGKPRGC